MSALAWRDTSRCPIGARCVSCGVSDAELFPACTGAPDLCGAPAGVPCAPGCPSRADDAYPPGPLAVAVFGGPAASLCLRTCWACAATPPKLTADAAMRLVIEHREHIGEETRRAPRLRPSTASRGRSGRRSTSATSGSSTCTPPTRRHGGEPSTLTGCRRCWSRWTGSS